MPFKIVDDNSPEETQTTKTGLPKFVDSALSAIESPIRGMRGVGVGLQQAIKGVSPQTMVGLPSMSPGRDASAITGNAEMALERAAAATQPGYVPQDGERIGAAAGEMVGSAPIAYATGGFVPPQARLLFKMFGGAVSGGALSALYQKVEAGEIDPNPVVYSAVAGGAIPLIKPVTTVIKNALLQIADLASSSVGVRPGATAVAMRLGSAMKDVDGSAETIKKQIDVIQKTMHGVHEAAGNNLNSTRKAMGLPATLAEKGERKFGKRLLEESLDIDPIQVKGNPGYIQVKYNDSPIILPREVVGRIKDEMTEKYGEEITAKSPKQIWNEANKLIDELTTGPKKGMDETAKIKTLDHLREKIGDYTDYARSGLSMSPITQQDTAIFNDLLSKVNKTIWDDTTNSGIGNLGKKLRASERLYSQSRNSYDLFQLSFATPEKASRTVLGLLKGEVPEEILGPGQGGIEAIKEVERVSGKQFIGPLRRALAAKNFNEMSARSGWGLPSGALGKEYLPPAIKGLGTAAGLSEKGGSATMDPAVRSLMISAGHGAMEP